MPSWLHTLVEAGDSLSDKGTLLAGVLGALAAYAAMLGARQVGSTTSRIVVAEKRGIVDLRDLRIEMRAGGRYALHGVVRHSGATAIRECELCFFGGWGDQTPKTFICPALLGHLFPGEVNRFQFELPSAITGTDFQALMLLRYRDFDDRKHVLRRIVVVETSGIIGWQVPARDLRSRVCARLKGF